MPIAECVSFVTPTSKVASLGYENQNDFTLNIAVGPHNRFSPLPEDRGQQATTPGRFVNILTTNFNGTLDWFLGQSKATATDQTAICNPSNECVDTNIREKQFGIDVNTFDLFKIASKLSRTLSKVGTTASKKQAVAIKKQAKALYTESWSAVWSLPEVITSCTDAAACAKVDNSATINGLSTNSNTLLKLIQTTNKQIRTFVGKRPTETKLAARAKVINTDNQILINTIRSSI